LGSSEYAAELSRTPIGSRGFLAGHHNLQTPRADKTLFYKSHIIRARPQSKFYAAIYNIMYLLLFALPE
jgi:hypothetical protein